MSGLEVVGLVAAIVSAFTGGTDLFIKWRDRKRQRRREAENNNTELILRRGAPAVQNEYDADFRRLGQAFARGDEIGRTALMEQLIMMQHVVITLLSQAQSNNDRIFPQRTTLIASSEGVRTGAINALGQQFQRLSQAAPIQSSISTAVTVPKSRVCKDRLQAGRGRYSAYRPGYMPGYMRSYYYCRSCTWKCWGKGTGPAPFNFLDDYLLHPRFLLQAGHIRDRSHYFPCLICPTTDNPEEFSEEQLWKHLVLKHWYKSAIKAGYPWVDFDGLWRSKIPGLGASESVTLTSSEPCTVNPISVVPNTTIRAEIGGVPIYR